MFPLLAAEDVQHGTPRAVNASEINERWQRHGSDSAHMMAVLAWLRRLRQRTTRRSSCSRPATTTKTRFGASNWVRTTTSASRFDPQKLTARVRAVMRRAVRESVGDSVIVAGDVEIDIDKRLVTKAGEPVSVTRTEWMLLQHLASDAGRVMLNMELLSKVGGPERIDDLHYLRVWISRLRSKLETDHAQPSAIKTLQGIGFTLDIDGRLSEEASAQSSTAG